MDVDDRTRAIMERAKQRKAELDCEEGKENSEIIGDSYSLGMSQLSKENSTVIRSSPIKERETNENVNKSTGTTPSRRSAFAELAQDYDEFAQQSPPKTRVLTKENFSKGRSPRLSIGETRPSVMCTPAGFANVSRSPNKHPVQTDIHISMRDSNSPIKCMSKPVQRSESEEKHIRFAHPISATSTYYEESSGSSPSLSESTIVAGNLVNSTLQSLPNTSVRKASDEIDENESRECGAHLFIRKKTPTKSSSTSSIHACSPQPFVRGGSTSSFSRVLFNPSATSSPKTEDVSINVDDNTCCSPKIAKGQTLYEERHGSTPSDPLKDNNLLNDHAKNMSPIRSAAVENAAARNIAHMLEERIKETHSEVVPMPKFPIYSGSVAKETDTPVVKTQWRGATNTPVLTGSTPGEPTRPDVRATNIKSLRNRWEFSSITGTPLHPDESEDALVQAAMKMRDTYIPRKIGQKTPGKLNINGRSTPTDRSDTASPVAKSPRCGLDEKEELSKSLLQSRYSTPKSAHVEEEVVTEDILDEVEEHQNISIAEESTNISRFIDDAFDFMGSSPVKTPAHAAPLATPEATPAVVKQKTPPKPERKYVDEVIDSSINYSEAVKDEKKGSALQYTISYYRKRAREEQAPNPNAEKIDLTSSFSAPSQQIIGGTSFLQPTFCVEELKRKLQEIIYAQKTKVNQASKALQLCRQKEQFRGSHEEATAQWAVLIETEIQRAAENELHRLNTQGLQSTDGPLGSLTLSYIAVELNRDFVETYANIRSGNVFYFCIILRSADKVLHSAIVSSEEAVKKGVIEIVYPLTLKDLPTNFTGSLDVYSLRTVRAQYTHEEKFGLKGSTMKNKTISRHMPHTPAPSDSSFQLVGRLALDIHVPNGKKRLLLSDVRHPLEGHITIKMKKLPMGKSTTTHSGFLSMFQRTKEGLGSWNRYWCVLEQGGMKFWRRPEDEINEKTWLVLLDLQTCAGEKEGASEANEPCQYMHSFFIDVWVPKEGQDAESLNRTGRPEMEKLRVMLAADTKEDMRSWLEDINSTVKQLLTWNRPFSFNK